jgi:hypothetical protein
MGRSATSGVLDKMFGDFDDGGGCFGISPDKNRTS